MGDGSKPSRLEQRVSRLEAAMERHFKIDLDAQDADDEESRARGAEAEAAREEREESGGAVFQNG